MNVLPVLVRELHAESRRPANYWLRVLGPAVLLLFFLLIGLTTARLAPGEGGRLFGYCNGILFIAIWIVAPMLTADCISREKRDGTLGLLFLTPLKPGSIVIAKGLVNALRGLALLLSALPVLTIPLLLGGVSSIDILRATLLDLGALLLALMAGLRASSVCREWSRAMVLAICLSFSFAFIYLQLHAILLWGRLQNLEFGWAVITGARGAWSAGSSGMMMVWSGQNIGWRGWAGPRIPTPTMSLQVATVMFGVSVFVLLWMVIATAWRLKRNWQEEPPSKRDQWWLQTFCTPRYWQKFFHRKMSRTLDRNPIGWLQRYSWSARMAKWGWCLVLILYECLVVVGADWDNHMTLQAWPALGVVSSMAFSAASSFGRERQTGAMELILVTPLRVKQIINGRLLGIWNQFLPSLCVWLIVWVILNDRQFDLVRVPFLVFFLGSFVSIAVIGLYFSMHRLHFMTAWLLTGLLGILVPVLMAMITQGFVFKWGWQRTIYFTYLPSGARPSWFHHFPVFVCGLLTFQILVAMVAWVLLHRNLSRRAFVIT